jgi:hypothetical protein
MKKITATVDGTLDWSPNYFTASIEQPLDGPVDNPTIKIKPLPHFNCKTLSLICMYQVALRFN